MNDKEKIVLIDGHSILNRAFYGVPELTNGEGLHTNAVYGFLNIMFKIIDEEQPTHLAVAFDVKAPTFRHEMYAEYKGTRKAMPDELREQVPIIKEVLQAMQVKTVELPGYEADDILGTLAKQSEQAGMMVRIISGDRDLLQLATETIQIRIPKTKRTGTEIENYYWKDVQELYQVTPIEFIDLKALMGDTSDNIPGVPSVGIKTATDLIITYKSVENLYEHVEEITKKKLKENLINGKELAFLSKELATINTKAPVELSLADTKIQGFFTAEAYEYMKRLEFKTLLKRFDQGMDSKMPEISYKIITDFQEAGVVFSKAKKSKAVGVRALTEQTDGQNEVLGLALAFQEQEAYIIEKKWFITEDILLQEFANLLYDEQIVTGIFDVKKQMKVLQDISKDANAVFDNAIAAYLLNPIKDSYHYDDIARDILHRTLPGYEELVGKLTVRNALEQEHAGFYQAVAYEAVVALESIMPLKNQLEETGQAKLFYDIEMPLAFSLGRMEREGVRVEEQALEAYSEMLGERISVLEQEIYEAVGENFNINSPKQLGVILVEKMNVKGLKKTKTGYSTSADVLEKLAPEYPVINKILEYRQMTKLKSTYADGLRNFISADGRIHGTFNQTITATGRISSTEPNLQNIPIRMEIGKALRKVFVPKEGCQFIDADYSQIELRILAHISDDGNLIDAYKTETDIHKITAAKVFNTPLEEVTPQQRSNAKAVNFGIVYGISSFGLSQDLSITKKEAETYIKQYFETYPKIKEFLDRVVAETKEQGYVTTLFGRRRPVPELASGNFMVRSFGERIAMNSPIQGTAADIIKLAMIRTEQALQEAGLEAKIVLQVHDELLLEVPEHEMEQAKEIVQKTMPSVVELAVPLEIGIGTGTNWLEAH